MQCKYAVPSLSPRRIRALFLSLALAAAIGSVQAATIWVNTNSDAPGNDGRCSLREAIAASESNAALGGCAAGSSGTADVIRFDWNDFEGGTVTGAVISLSQGPLTINDADLNIDNTDGQRLTITAQNQHRVMVVDQPAGSTLELINIGVQNGQAVEPDPHGGAVLFSSGTQAATLRQVTIRNSQALAGGGGALAFGNDLEILTIDNSRFTNNSALRGGVIGSVADIHQSSLDLTISDSGLFGNSASNGGAIALALNTIVGPEVIRIEVADSQIGSNSAEADGGAIHFEPGVIDAALLIGDSLFEGNQSPDGIGGAVNVVSGSVGSGQALVDVQRSTFLGNAAFVAAAINADGVPTRLINNLFLDNRAGSSAAVLVAPVVSVSYDAPSTLVANTFSGNLAGQAAGQPADAATDLAFFPDWSETDNRLVGNLFLPAEESSAPACDFGQGDSSQAFVADVSNNLAVTDTGLANAECTLTLSDGQGMSFADPIAVHALREDTGSFTKPRRIRFGAGSLAVDAWPSNACRDETAFPIVLDLDRNRFVPDAGGNPFDGNPAITAGCDIGAFENREGRSLDINVTGTGRVFSDPVPSIDCTGNCSSFAQQFDTVSLRWLSQPGSVFAQWDGDCSGSAECEVNLDQNRVVLANFTATATHPIEIQLNGTGQGRVVSFNSTYGMDCPDYNCTGHFEAGSVVALEAIPAEGSSFVAWEGDCQFDCDDPVIGLTLNGPRAFIARFDFDDAIFGDRFESP